MTRSAAPSSNMIAVAVERREEDIIGPKCWKKIVFNWGTISQVLAVLVIIIFLSSIALSVLPTQYTVPESPLVRMLFLFVGAKIIGLIVTFLGIPDILGMLCWGILFRNVGIGEFDGFGFEATESFLRDVSLVNIMLLAGMGLDFLEVKQLLGVIAKLTIIPTTFEVVVIAVVAHFLINFPWLWAALLGLVVTAVSPNVVISILMDLKEKRLGMNKGIHTVIAGMTGCNDVISIFCFGVVLGIIFSTGTLTDQILQGPIGVVIGLVYGGVIGYMILYLPSTRAVVNCGYFIYYLVKLVSSLESCCAQPQSLLQFYSNILRFGLTLCAGLVAVQGSKSLGYPSGGALGCMTLAFVVGNGSKDRPENKTEHYLNSLWAFFKPISFALIGKELDFSVIDSNTLWQGAVFVGVGLIARIIVGYFCTTGGEFSWRERAYITLSSLPKATVQATIGPIALDLARRRSPDNGQELYFANTVLICSVVAIVLTAPLGAVLMERLAPKWLKNADDDDETGRVNVAYV